MNTLNSISSLYLHINLLIAGSFLTFFGALQVSRIFKTHLDSRQTLRISQILMVACLLLPIGLRLVPKTNLPEITFSQFRPASEGTGTKRGSAHSLGSAQKRITADSLIRQTAPLSEQLTNWVQENESAAAAFAVFLWCIGFAFFSGRLIRNTARLKKLLSNSTLIRTQSKIRIAVSEEVSVPFSIRWFKHGWVVIPLEMLGRRKDLRLALKHELQHHRQGDTPWAIIIEIMLCWFYLNPAMYLWKRKITELQEFSCDEALLGQRGVSSFEYGNCLIRVAETALATREMYVGTTCMAASYKNPRYFKSFLQRRIEMIADYGRSTNQKWIGIGIGITGLLFTVIAAYGAEQLARKSAGQNSGNLAVNEAIQKITEKALREAILVEKAAEGFALVADPNTGKILAVANIDSQNKKSGYWALSHLMEPASLSKVLIAAQAIEKKLTTPQETHSCENGNYKFGDQVYHDWKETGWAALTTEETITNSSDICSIKIGEKIGANGLVTMLKDFGFGPNGTATKFPLAQAGQLPPNDNPKKPRLVPYVSSGFGYRITPIEMLQAYSAIANGGNLMMPQTANAPDSSNAVIRRVLSPETAQKMRSILQAVVTKGTAKGRAESPLFTTAGKTATGFSSSRLGTDKKADLAQFIGFAPVNNPRIAVYVGIRDPHTGNTGAHGSEHAAPVFKEIVERVLQDMKVAPDKPRS